ncbi:hypothetical protein MC885_007017 [Smutsia gigantea]|nr:hypothetical protein MC885_007017 [Smutsia gigantea]
MAARMLLGSSLFLLARMCVPTLLLMIRGPLALGDLEWLRGSSGQSRTPLGDRVPHKPGAVPTAAAVPRPASALGHLVALEPSRTVSGRYKSTTTASEEDISSRYPRTERSGFNRYNRDANTSGSLVSSSTLEKKIEDLEKEVVRERQENLRLVRLMQDKEEMIGKLKEEIDLLNRDLDDIEDENEQLKQENKTLLKVVGQLTR